MTVGRLVVLEGVDGAGKTTLVARLVRTLQSEGVDAVSYSLPGQEPNTLGEHEGVRRRISRWLTP
jgi:thymidylate kinase